MSMAAFAVLQAFTPSLQSRFYIGQIALYKYYFSDKVPHPPYASIVYRKEWHPKIVVRNTTVHNNETSVIIGHTWKARNEEVEQRFNSGAYEAKRQHLIDHPDYQYQPRKPSEKKKRMTKNKIAKLAAAAPRAEATQQQPLPSDFDPVALLDDTLQATIAAQDPINIETYVTPYVQRLPTVTPLFEGASAIFNTGADPDNTLKTMLDAYNSTHASLGPNTQIPPGRCVLAPEMANGVNGVEPCAIPNIDVVTDVNAIPEEEWMNIIDKHSGPINPDTTVPGICYKGPATGPNPAYPLPVFDPLAEVERQARLETELDTFFDIDGAALSSPHAASADTPAAELPFDLNAIDAGNGTYSFDFEGAEVALPGQSSFEMAFEDLVNAQD